MVDSEPELESLAGTLIGGKYRIDELIGRGGMGAVYRATNIAIGKRVALKFLHREAALDRDAVTRFQREAEAASAVESAHIVEIFDSGTTEDGRPFLVMELLRGEDLRQRLRREGPLPAAEVVRLGRQVARALRRAHEAGIVHRDLKPDNVFLCERDDDPMFVKLVDFGISKIAPKGTPANALTRRGVVLGTAYYMSPEQAQALPDIDGRTDLFSLGAILYESLTGAPPHTGRAYESVLVSICTKDAPPLRERVPMVPEALASVVHRALARDRSERYQSAAELYADLTAATPRDPTARQDVLSEPELALTTDPTTPILAETAPSPIVTPTARRPGSFGRRAAGVALLTMLPVGLLLGWPRAPEPADPTTHSDPGFGAELHSAGASSAQASESLRRAGSAATIRSEPAAPGRDLPVPSTPPPTSGRPSLHADAAASPAGSVRPPLDPSTAPPRRRSGAVAHPAEPSGVAAGLELATEP